MTKLPDVDWSKLPAPADDGGADHLRGLALPSIPLPSTQGPHIDLSTLAGVAVVYVYPMTGRPGVALPENWDMIPGARGCTPQACAFRDHFAELRAVGVDHVLGLSAQSTDDQTEAASRLHLPFPLVSDAQLAFADALSPADLHGRRPQAAAPSHDDHCRRPHRARVLSRIPPRPERARRDRMACRPRAESPPQLTQNRRHP